MSEAQQQADNIHSDLAGNVSNSANIDHALSHFKLKTTEPVQLQGKAVDVLKRFRHHEDIAAIPHDFIGHVGGDDFVMLLHPDNWRQQVESALDIFSIESALMYNTDERQRGYIIAEGRQGQSMHFPLMSLSMAVVPCTDHAYPSHVAVSEIASEVKHLAKKQSGNSIVVNRRMPELVTTTHYPRITIVGISHCTE